MNRSQLRHYLSAFFFISIVGLALAAFGPTCARAQEPYPPYPPPYPRAPRYAADYPHIFTFTPFLGTRFGGRIDVNTPTVDYLPLDSSFNWGFNIGASIVRNLFAEFMWNRQTTTLSAHHSDTGDTVTLTNHANLDMYQGDLLYEIPQRGMLWPFVVAGLGVTHFDSHGVLSFSNRFSYNIGGGVKYFFSPHAALRLEARYSPSRTTTSSAVFCDPTLGCFTTRVSNHAQQGQINVGLELRF